MVAVYGSERKHLQHVLKPVEIDHLNLNIVQPVMFFTDLGRESDHIFVVAE